MPQPRSLGALLREMWDDEVANRRRAFALARSGEPPADSKMTEAQVAAWKAEKFEEPGTCEEQVDWRPEADEFIVQLESLSGRQWDEYLDLAALAAAELRTILDDERKLFKDAKAAGVDVTRFAHEESRRVRFEKTRAQHKFADAWRFLVRHSLVEATGLRDHDGPYKVSRTVDGVISEADLEMFEGSGWLSLISGAVRHLHSLSEEERGNFGGRRPQTSRSSATTVGHAPSPSEPAKGVTSPSAPRGGGILAAAGTRPSAALLAPS